MKPNRYLFNVFLTQDTSVIYFFPDTTTSDSKIFANSRFSSGEAYLYAIDGLFASPTVLAGDLPAMIIVTAPPLAGRITTSSLSRETWMPETNTRK